MKKYILPILFMSLLYWSCEDEALPEDCAGVAGGDNICGCTDSTATNYDSTATFNDESCEYDTTPPTVAITFPQDNSIVFEMASITCVSIDDKGIEKVELWVNEVSTDIFDNTEPYSFDWNTTLIDNGNYTITIRAYDTSDNITDSEPIVLTVDNTQSYPQPVNITSVVFEDNSFEIIWTQNQDEDFQSYTLIESDSEDMSNYQEILTTEDQTDTSYSRSI